jgi:hypothetical protein
MNWRSDTPMSIPVERLDPEQAESRSAKIRGIIIKYMNSSNGSHQLSIIPTGRESPSMIKEHDEVALEVFGLAYPTKRSWENLARILAEIPDNETSAIQNAINGTIGYAQGLKFYKFFIENRKGIDIEDILKNPTKQDWKHMTINDSDGIFINLIEAAKNGRIKEVLNVYVAISHAGAKDLLSGNRIKDIFKHEYFKGYSAEETKEMTQIYLHEFKDIMKKSTE